MSQEHGIEGEEPLFQFDNVEGLETDNELEECLDSTSKLTSTPADLLDMSYIPLFSSLDLSVYTTASTPAEVVRSISMTQTIDAMGINEAFDSEAMDFKGKGKAITQPLDIQQRDAAVSEFDLFCLSSPASGSSRGRRAISVPSSSASTAQTATSFAFSAGATSNFYYGSYETNLTTPGTSYTSNDAIQEVSMEVEDECDDHEGSYSKGKSRAEPPVLPPLTFSPREFTHGETNWPISPHFPTILPAPSDHDSQAVEFPTSYDGSGTQREPTESSPSASVPRIPCRTRSFSSLSTKSAKSLAARSVTKLKLSFSGGKRSNLARKLLLGRNNDTIRIHSDLDTDVTMHKLQSSLSEPCSPYMMNERLSLFDESTSSIPPPNLFDKLLPREVKLAIFKAFLTLYEEEGEFLRQSQSWTASVASRPESRWIGTSKGLIELVRLSSVSKDWQHLVFDGQLWANLDLGAFTSVPSPLLERLAAICGSFVRTVDFSGHTRLSNSTLIDITKSMCIYNSNSIYDNISSTTQLTHVNLSGCSSVTSHSLHHLLKHSPWLVSLKAKGSKAVTNETCQTLAHFCPLLQSLDFSRCHKMDSDGICALLTIHQALNTQSSLKELRISGLRRANDALLILLGRYAQNLEVLDLSNARGLHNTALDAFVSCHEDDCNEDVLILSSREVGRDPGDTTKYRRRITKLRHLNLSSCPLLTDTALSHLAHAVPKLEILELASIGAELRDDGLVRLLRTTPLLRRLDLEEACDITDSTLAAITPEIPEHDPALVDSPQSGALLEHLILSYAVQISNDATLALIRACTRLKRLELDNTRVSGSTIKEFVRLCRKREATNAGVVAIDCRGISENTVKELSGITRTRMGWRSWDARALQFLDARDEALGVGQDECDDMRVTLKSFYSWQTVDAVATARQKRLKADRKSSHDGEYGNDSSRRSTKWWTPGGRRVSGTTSPDSPASDRDRESCVIM